jgi:RimJ/RimL family protein N-acetyltransferase
MMSLILHEMETENEAYVMMEVRNEVRGFMTHNIAEIMPSDQLKWFEDTYLPARERGDLFGYILRTDEQDPIGYGLISKRDGKWWVSGGLTEDARGKGAGHFLFQEMTQFIHEDLRSEEAWLDVLRGNEVAINLYRKLGYVAVNDTAELLVMVHSQVHQEAEAA